MLHFEKILQRITPATVAKVDEIKVGRMIDDGFALFHDARRAITVAGINWIDVAFITTSKSILSVALSPFCINSIAFIPAGVLAPPMPNIFDARFIEIHLYESSLSPLKSRFTIGRKSRESFLSSPVFSSSFNRESHIEYMAVSLMSKFIAPSTPSIIAGKISAGFTISSSIEEAKRSIVNTKFIQYFTSKITLICVLVYKSQK